MHRMTFHWLAALLLLASPAAAQFDGDLLHIELKAPHPKPKHFRQVVLDGYFKAKVPPWQWRFLPMHDLIGEPIPKNVHLQTRWSVNYVRSLQVRGKAREITVARENARSIVIESDKFLQPDRKRGIAFRAGTGKCLSPRIDWNAGISILYFPNRTCAELERTDRAGRARALLPLACRRAEPALKNRALPRCVGKGRGVYELLFAATANVFDAKLKHVKRTFASFQPLRRARPASQKSAATSQTARPVPKVGRPILKGMRAPAQIDKPAPKKKRPVLAKRAPIRTLRSEPPARRPSAKSPGAARPTPPPAAPPIPAEAPPADNRIAGIKRALRRISVFKLMRHIKEGRNPLVRALAAEELGRRGPKAAPAVMVLITALSDKSEPLRMAAARSLGRIGSKARKALPALRRAAGDPSQDVAQAAEEALERLRP